MNIMTDQELNMRTRTAFGAGFAMAAIAVAVLYHWLYGWTPVPVGAPEIVRQTPSQTVARIPTMHGGVRVDCTVTIDQAKNVWSITC